jgi:UDP-galactopyranose mutase
MDLLVFSHLRWDFVYQRPQHLLSRAARSHRVIFIEEPIVDPSGVFVSKVDRGGVNVVVPHLPEGRAGSEHEQLRGVVAELVTELAVRAPALWYYTPMALPWTRALHETASLVVYDCMDHLAGFRGAPPGLIELERELMNASDLVFTGGASLHQAKSNDHSSAYCFPSSVDVAHFGRARRTSTEPSDQLAIAHPRIGYFGVLDERIDWDLLARVAHSRPDWHFVLVGPTAKVNPDDLPIAPNIHYLGPKRYEDLPAYLASWDVAMMPFARNEATRYISPTKTPEYLAGGRPVASTSITDVVELYARKGLVEIGDTPAQFIAAIERALNQDVEDLCARADAFFADQSWDRTWTQMEDLLLAKAAENAGTTRSIEPSHSSIAAASLVGMAPVGGMKP